MLTTTEIVIIAVASRPNGPRRTWRLALRWRTGARVKTTDYYDLQPSLRRREASSRFFFAASIKDGLLRCSREAIESRRRRKLRARRETTSGYDFVDSEWLLTAIRFARNKFVCQRIIRLHYISRKTVQLIS